MIENWLTSEAEPVSDWVQDASVSNGSTHDLCPGRAVDPRAFRQRCNLHSRYPLREAKSRVKQAIGRRVEARSAHQLLSGGATKGKRTGDVVLLPSEHDFWCPVVSCRDVTRHLRVCQSRQSKVANLEIAVLVDKDIGRFLPQPSLGFDTMIAVEITDKITVHHTGRMHVFESSLRI